MNLQSMRLALRATALGLTFGIISADGATAQGYPSKPIRIISPLAPGRRPMRLADWSVSR